MTGDGIAFVRRITQSRYSAGWRAMTRNVIWLRFEKPGGPPHSGRLLPVVLGWRARSGPARPGLRLDLDRALACSLVPGGGLREERE